MTGTQADVNQPDVDPRTHGEHVEDLAEAYALGALDDDERRRVDHHLATCAACRRLIDEIRRITTLLPFSSPPMSRPSPAAKIALMARIQQQQAQPATITPPTPGARASGSHRRQSFWPRWGMTLVPAALAVLLISSLVWSYSLSRRLTSADHQRATYASQLTWLYGGQSGAQIYAFQPMRQDSQAGGRLCVDSQQSSVMVVAWALDPGRQHILWAMNPDGSKTEVMPLDVSTHGNVVQMVNLDAGFNDTTTLMIASDGPNAGMELMLKPTPASPPASPTATWPYDIRPVPVAY